MQHRSFFAIALLGLALLGGCGEQLPDTQERPAVDGNGGVKIVLSGDTATVEGGGASVQDGTVEITAGGVYEVSGALSDGRLVVNAPGDEVTVTLNGADITCSWGSPLYIYQAKTTTLLLTEGTENALTDGAAYTYADSISNKTKEEPNACLYSKEPLVIAGKGALRVTSNFNNGITGKDTLAVYDAALTVEAVNHGINGKDSNTIEGASITVRCGGDALRSTNDSDPELGWIKISGATLDLTAGEDGVQAETRCEITSGACTITTGGGSGAELSEDASAKGIKAGTGLILSGGAYTMDCADDAFHAGGDLTVSDGVFSVASGDDAFHADETLTVSGGAIDVTASYEGLEGSDILVSGGTICVVSSDDGLNAAGGNDGSGFMGPGGRGGGAFGPGDTNHTLTVTGGTLDVLAGGDGLDSNGSLTITGGVITVFSTGNADGALDSESGISLEGGTVFAVTGGSMPGAPQSPAQCTISAGFDQTLAEGITLTFSGPEKTYSFPLLAAARNVVFSAPELKSGQVWTVSCDDAVLAELTLTEGLTTFGQTGWGGGPGGMHGARPDGGQPPFDGQRPAFEGNRTDGAQRPDGQTPPDGQMPPGGEKPGDWTPPDGEKPEDGHRGGKPS